MGHDPPWSRSASHDIYLITDVNTFKQTECVVRLGGQGNETTKRPNFQAAAIDAVAVLRTTGQTNNSMPSLSRHRTGSSRETSQGSSRHSPRETAQAKNSNRLSSTQLVHSSSPPSTRAILKLNQPFLLLSALVRLCWRG